MMASIFTAQVQRIRKTERELATEEAVFAVSLADVEKALSLKAPKTEQELRTHIPAQFHDLLPLFMKKEADKLNPHKPGVDHKIKIKDAHGNQMPIPYGALYNMSRAELLVLKRPYVTSSTRVSFAPAVLRPRPRSSSSASQVAVSGSAATTER